MCGLSAWVCKESISSNRFNIFNDCVAHRGPDASKIEIFQAEGKNIAFGHKRLSIIDLDKKSNQPMNCENNKIIFNGEIYNYLELRDELSDLGVKFNTNSDTEVLIKSYIKWGENCLNKFNGMFAFLIYDEKKHQIFFARDRFGVKPLYYYRIENSFFFSSEIKQILTLECYKAEGNINTIGNFIENRYLDYSSETFFKNIYQIQPGEAGTLNLKNLELRKYKWYDLEKSTKTEKTSFLTAFNNSLDLRLRSDVEIGSFLSGGIDSSAIVYVSDSKISQLKQNNSIKTFTACFEEKEHDERENVKITKEKTSINAKFIFPQKQNFFEEIKKLIYFQDEPIWSTSIYFQSCIFKEANINKVKVMLDGQGADEIYCGYKDIFYPTYFRSLSFLKKIIEFLNCSNKLQIIKIILRNIMIRDKKKTIFNRLYDNKYKNNFKSLKEQTIFFLKFHLPALLHYEDRNSMQFSIEARLPFLDYKLVEFGFNIPDNEKISREYGKKIIRKSLKKIVPDSILENKVKKGFQGPQIEWLLSYQNEVKNDIKGLLIFDVFNEAEIKKLLKNFKQNTNNQSLIARLYFLSVWVKVFNIKKIS